MKFSRAAFLVGAMVAAALSNDREYILILDLQTLSNAYCYCRQQGMTLATFRDETDLGLAASLCHNCTVWIGLYNLFTWFWINSDPYRFQKWGPGPITTYPCVVMKNGLWYRENCQQRHLFVCYRGPTGALPLSLSFHFSCPSTPIQLGSRTPSPQATRVDFAFNPNQGAIGVFPPSRQDPSITLRDQQTTPVYANRLTASSLAAAEGVWHVKAPPPLGGRQPGLSSSQKTPSSFPFTSDVQATPGGFQSNPPVTSIQRTRHTTGRQPKLPGSGEVPSGLPFTSDVQATSKSFQNNATDNNIQQTLHSTDSQSQLSSHGEVLSRLPFTSDVQATPRSFQSNPTVTNIQQTLHNTGLPVQDRTPVVIQENRTWFEALSACRARGQLMAGRVRLQQGLKAWLGLHRHGLWGYWAWADGSRVEEPQSWGEGEPSDPIWGNCGTGTGTEEGVTWEDECCEQKFYYVCESNPLGQP